MAYDGPKAPSSEKVAEVIVRQMFENGEQRLPAGARAVAKAGLTAALREWKGQLLAEADARLSHEQRKASDYRRELAEVRLKYDLLRKGG